MNSAKKKYDTFVQTGCVTWSYHCVSQLEVAVLNYIHLKHEDKAQKQTQPSAMDHVLC